jgi:hypothetical protein
MSKLWLRFKSFIGTLDFEDIRKDVADALKKASFSIWALWLLSMLRHLPVSTLALLKLVGISVVAIQTSNWVSTLFFGIATLLYVAQAVLRAKVRKDTSC